VDSLQEFWRFFRLSVEEIPITKDIKICDIVFLDWIGGGSIRHFFYVHRIILPCLIMAHAHKTLWINTTPMPPITLLPLSGIPPSVLHTPHKPYEEKRPRNLLGVLQYRQYESLGDSHQLTHFRINIRILPLSCKP